VKHKIETEDCNTHSLSLVHHQLIRRTFCLPKVRRYRVNTLFQRTKLSAFRLFDSATTTTLRAQKHQRWFAIFTIAWIAAGSKYQRHFVANVKTWITAGGPPDPGGVLTGSSGSFQKTRSSVRPLGGWLSYYYNASPRKMASLAVQHRVLAKKQVLSLSEIRRSLYFFIEKRVRGGPGFQNSFRDRWLFVYTRQKNLIL